MQVAKIKQTMMPDSREGSVRPVIRTFYDHLQVNYTVNFLGFLIIIHVQFIIANLFGEQGSYMTSSKMPLLSFSYCTVFLLIKCFDVGCWDWLLQGSYYHIALLVLPTVVLRCVSLSDTETTPLQYSLGRNQVKTEDQFVKLNNDSDTVEG